MITNDPLQIHLEHIAQSGDALKINLSNDFFKGLDQQEILGGEVELTVRVKDNGSHVFLLSLEAQGKVTTQCDRCLDEVELSVNVADEFRVLKWGEEPSDDDDMACMEGRDGIYDISWNAYELIELSLPTVRLHPEGGCNEEMLGKLKEYTRTSEETE